MTDLDIIEMYWSRDEAAITQTEKLYGKYCYMMAYKITCDKEDAKECVNDTLMRVWNSIPPERPRQLRSFIGRITRNLSFDKYKAKKTSKCNKGELPLVLHELDECIPSALDVEETVTDGDLTGFLNDFLEGISRTNRNVFLARYLNCKRISDIAKIYALNEKSVKSMLLRTRLKLKDYLEKENILL